MSVNLLNKVSIDAGGGSNPLELTIGAAAENVSFNNMGTGLSATNVQTALKQVLAQNGYAVCETAGNIADKTVTITDFVLRVGSRLVIKFENQNLASSPTLNVNNTGAKALKVNGEDINPAIIEEDSVFLINYNGNSYDVIIGGGANAGAGISIEEYTFLAANWDDDEYLLESTYPSSRYDIIEIGSSNANTTQAMLDAWTSAEIYGYEPTNKIIARGIVPSIDIVMVLVVVDKNASNGGHTIKDETTTFTQRTGLKFVGATVTDDSVGDNTVVTYNKTSIGLGNVDNTSDLNKPISTATQSALDNKMVKVTGTEGQIISFNAQGNPVAQDLEVATIKACYDTSPTLYAHAVDDLIYYNQQFYNVKQAIAVNDILIVDTNIEAASLSTGTSVYIKNLPNTGGGGGTGGHVIVDESGSLLTQRSKLKFLNAEVTDDEENDTTIVNPQGGTTIVTPPTVVVGTYTYNGSPQGPTITWATGMSDYCVVTNATQTDAGSYQLTIALKNTAKMVWNDGASGLTTADKIYNYSIAKANQTITLSSNSVTLDMDHLTADVTVSGAYGAISATTSDNTIATASVSDSTVTISNVNEARGSATITVSVAGTENYNAATDSTISVTADFLQIVSFSSGTDAQIKAMLDAYYADKITWAEMGWAVGDTRTIHLNAMTAPNPNSSNTWAAQDITVVIVAHDHTDLATAINGHTKACITVQTREVMNNVTAAYNDAGHIYIDGSASKDTSKIQWSNVYTRTYLNNTVAAALPSGDFKSAIKSSTHLRHLNPSDSTTIAEQTTDMFFLPSLPEILGPTDVPWYVASSPAEGTQFDYYATQANRVKYGNNNGVPNSTAQSYWTGSISTETVYLASDGYRWIAVGTSGGFFQNIGTISYALAPAWAM